MANPSRMKREIDKAKKERAAEKRERRQRSGAPDDSLATDEAVAAVTSPQPSSMSNDEVLLRLERLHAQFDADELDFEAFERAKETLLAQLATE